MNETPVHPIHANLERAVDRAVEEKAGMFGEFYRPLLRECAQRIGEWEQGWERELRDVVDFPRVAESLLISIVNSCSENGVRALVTAFRSRADDPECAGTGYAEFHAWAGGDEGRGRLLARFPELRRLLDLLASRRLRHAEAVLRAAAADKQILEETFGVGGRVTSLVPGLGDPHRGGRSVCLVHWSSGVTVLYKPQRESCHGLLDRLRNLVDEDGSYFGPLCPTTVVRPDHLWQERIEHEDLEESTGPAAYFRRFGRCAALLSMIGATDLHFENVISVAGGPVVIDTETLVSLPTNQGREGAGALAHDIEMSVLNTMLFPTRIAGAKLDVDLSGIGCVVPGESRQLRSFTVVDGGTDDIRFDHTPVVLEHGTNMATVHGEKVDPRSWADDIVLGFDEAREMLRPHRAAVERLVGGEQGWSVRRVMRPTYVYARFLEASTHPAYLASTDDRSALLEKLPKHFRGVDESAVDALHDEETAALLDLDVPFFDIECDATEFRCNGKEQADAAVTAGRTPRDAALQHVREFFERPAARDLAYLDYALGSSVDDVWDTRRAAGEGSRPGTVPLKDVGAWHTQLRDLVVSGVDDRPTWLTPKLDADGLRLGNVDGVLHEGGGLLVYLAEAADGEPLIDADPGAAYTAATPPDLPRTVVPQTVSPFTGALSTVVTGLELRRRGLDTARVPDLLSMDWEQLDPDTLSVVDFDYLNGFSGFLAFLGEYPEDSGKVLEGATPGRLLSRLVDLDGSPHQHTGELGLAHGRFGRIAAMSALAGREEADETGRAREHLEAFASAYLRNRWQDQSLRSAGACTTWCKGYGGVAFAAAKMLRTVGYSVERMRDALAPEVGHLLIGNEGVGSDISFCHGLAGRIAMLCWLADRLSWPELRSEAGWLSDAFAERYGAGGWSFGVGSEADLPSFLYGRSGWYYAQLMLRDPRVALPLSLGGR